MAVDKDRRGTLELNELMACQFPGGVRLSPQTALRMMRIFDADFNGSVSFIEYDLNRKAGSRKYNINLYNEQWELLPFEDPDYPCLPDVRIEKPALLDEMIGYSKKLVRCAGDPDFLRVDLYTHNGGFLFGEMTFYDDAGYGRFDPTEYDSILGQELMIDTDRQ